MPVHRLHERRERPAWRRDAIESATKL